MLDTGHLLEVRSYGNIYYNIQCNHQFYHRHWRTLLKPEVRFTVGEGSRRQQLVISFILGLQNVGVETPGTYPDRLSLNVGRQTLTPNNTITRTWLAYMINCRQHWLAYTQFYTNFVFTIIYTLGYCRSHTKWTHFLFRWILSVCLLYVATEPID